MLSKPKNGWTTVQIKDFEAIASYLVDIPFDWLCWSPYEDSEEDIIVRNEKLKRLIDEVECELEKEAKRYNKSFLRWNNE